MGSDVLVLRPDSSGAMTIGQASNGLSFLKALPSATFRLCPLLFLLIVPCSLRPIHAQNPKVIVDQDARGPASTDMQSILMFVQSPDVEVLGVTLVSGDQFVKEQTQRTLRALEIAGRTDIPVVPGAEAPLINSKEESELWEQRFGKFSFKGAWTPRFYHPPDVVPELDEGEPTTKALDEHAANFIVRMVRRYPNEVTLWAGGPLTNLALALSLEPKLASLAKELVLMGAGFNEERGNIHRSNARREFNWWWDPEAVHIVMRAAWKKITITPHDLGVKVRLTEEVKAEIAKADTPLARYLTRFSRLGSMWDEVSVAAFFEPAIIKEKRQLYVNIDIDHGASYGQTIFLGENREAPSWWKPATVLFEVDMDRFFQIYIDLMTRAAPGPPNR